jgi:predicted O-methyltransferase YrrM
MSIAAKFSSVPMFSQLEEMVKEIPGWSPLDQLYSLYLLGLATAPLAGDFLEIGTWCGRSGVVLGTAARAIGKTHTHCIDLFPVRNDWKMNTDGTYFLEVAIDGFVHRANQEQTVWANAFETQVSQIYRDFNNPRECLEKQLHRLNLNDIVEVHRGTSSTFATCREKTFQCKLAFIDGDHGYDAVCKDISNVKAWLVEGGWICFDDAFSSYEWVDRAIRDLIISDPQFDLCQQLTRKLFVARKKPR